MIQISFWSVARTHTNIYSRCSIWSWSMSMFSFMHVHDCLLVLFRFHWKWSFWIMVSCLRALKTHSNSFFLFFVGFFYWFFFSFKEFQFNILYINLIRKTIKLIGKLGNFYWKMFKCESLHSTNICANLILQQYSNGRWVSACIVTFEWWW